MMKNYLHSFLNLTLLLPIITANSTLFSTCSTSSASTSCSASCSSSCGSSCNSCCTCHSIYMPRSANSNTAYNNLVYFYQKNNGACSGGFDIGFEYQRSFHGNKIAKCMFGTDTLVFQGSRAVNRDADALLADYFGLAPDFKGTLALHPRIQNFNIHFQSLLNFECWPTGLYGQLNFTFSHQKRKLFGNECSSSCSGCTADLVGTGTSSLPAGYMASEETTPIPTLKDALKGETTFGDMQTEWKFGKFDFSEQSHNGIAGVDLIFGYNFLREECGHFGIFFQYTAPTGNKPNPTYIFSPVVGNGKHHEVGCGITSHYELWNNGCDQSVVACLDGHITSMLKNCQVRSFDFNDKGCMSRYMLLKEMSVTDSTLGYIYTGSLINAINFTTRFVDVKVPVKGDATVKFIYHKGNWDFGIGYNLYGHSKERLCLKPGSPCNTINSNAYYGFKGCSGDYGFGYSDDGTHVTGHLSHFAQKLNTTENSATITSCASADNAIADTNDTSIVVNWTNTYDGTGTGKVSADAVPVDGTVAKTDLVAANLSNPAIAFNLVSSQSLLNIASGKAPRQLTNKGFATIDYTWDDCEWNPYVGIGAEAEGSSNCCDLKQWGIWIKGGISL